MTHVSLRAYQSAMLGDVRTAFAEHRRVLAVLPTGGGKCLGRGTPVMMFDGRVRLVEDIEVGDLLMGPDSRPRRVVSLARGREEMFRITPRKGDPYTVNRSHILSLRMTGGALRSCGIPDGSVVNLTVDEYLTRNATFRHCAKGWRAAVDFPAHAEPLRLDPYFLGLLLGDGASKGPGITTADPEISHAVRSYAATVGLQVREEPNSPRSVNLWATTLQRPLGRGHRSNPITLALHQYRLLNNKHIPHRYLTASRADRLELLAGIIDTDGHWTGKGFDICLKSERLMDGIIFVARSLGFAAYKARSRKTCGNNGVVGDYWRCNINGPVETIPCRVARKLARPRGQNKNPLVHGISVESVGNGEYFGFEVEGPDRLFLLGDFTVTHNTVSFAWLTRAVAAKGKRVVIVAHRVEIVDQISAALTAQSVVHGRIGPGHPMRQDVPVQVAMVQTLARRLDRVREPDMLVVDEAHHAVAGTWRSVAAQWQRARILGVTATPERQDGVGLRDAFDGLVVGPSVRDLIAEGHLAPFRHFSSRQAMDMTGIGLIAGDYNAAAVADAMVKQRIVGSAVEEYRRHADGLPAVAFCPTVAFAEQVARDFRRAGIPAASVDGRMPAQERAGILGGLRDGSIQVVTSCDLISEGFDVPAIAAAILLRPTKSLGLYLQQVGRALRPKPGGAQAIIIDHVGNGLVHGLVDAPRSWSLDGKKRRDAPPQVRQCETCFAVFPAGGAVDCDADPCGLAPKRSGERGAAETVDGQLQEITASDTAISDAPVVASWSRGADLRTAPLKELLPRAQTPEQLAEIARARRYKPAWVQRIIASRHKWQADRGFGRRTA